MKRINLFAESNRLDRLGTIGDPLEKVASTIDFEIFRPLLDEAIPRKKRDKGGRSPKDNVLMFKIRFWCKKSNMNRAKRLHIV